MRPETSLERAVYHHRDWRLELQRQCEYLRTNPPKGGVPAEHAMDLARALELAEPNRVHAVEMYLFAWRAAHNHPEGLERAFQLCLELGQLPTAAKVARILFLKTNEPRFAAREGMAWLDAGQPDSAVRALLAATRGDPGDELAALALATARREWPDVRAEIAQLRARAGSAPTDIASELLLQAARIARMLGADQDELYGQLLGEAVSASPLNESAFSLLETWLAGRGERDGLVSIYMRRVDAAPELALEVMRRAGTKWVLTKTQVGLGVQLLTRCLENGYASDAPIPGHLATIALLRRFAELAGANSELLNLIGRGLSREHHVVEMAALAAVGLDIAWTRMRNPQLSHPLAAVLGEVARDHPTLMSYCNEGGMAKGRAMSHQRSGVVYLDELPPDSLPSEPSGLLDLGELDPLEDEPTIPMNMDDLIEVDGGVPAAEIVDYQYSPMSVPPIVDRGTENDQRSSNRLRLPADVNVLLPTGSSIKAITRDIGEGGVFILTDSILEISSKVSLVVILPALDEWSVDEYALAGKIVRIETGGYAVDLVNPPGSYVSRVRALRGH